MNILIKNCYLLGDNPVNPVVNGDIAIAGDRLLKVGEAGELPGDWVADKVIDGKDLFCLPGLINCHTHAAMTILRSYADDLPLMYWLEQKIWPVEDRLTGDDVYWGTMLAVVEMIKSGTTTFNDMYMFMDETAQAVKQSGIRACLSRGLIGVGPSAELGLEKSRQLLDNWQGGASGRITVWLGPHAPYTCPPDYLRRVLDMARDYQTGMHIHVAETRDEIRTIQENYGKTPVAYLNDLGVFDLPVVAAHCVHLTDEDIAILADKRVAVAHNPESNMKLGSGIAPVVKLRQAGVTVGIGTDGASSNNNLDMFGEMRSAALLAKVAGEDPLSLPAVEVLSMATGEGARALRIEDQVGVLKPGYKADLIMVNLKQPHLCPRHNLVAHAVYAAEGGDVVNSIIDGKLVMENHRVLTVDEERVMEEVEAITRRLISKV